MGNLAAERIMRATRRGLTGPHLLAFVPALALTAFWLGGERVLVAVALGLPLLIALFGGFSGPEQQDLETPACVADAQALAPQADALMAIARTSDRQTLCLLIEVEPFELISERHGARGTQLVQQRLGDRLRDVMRPSDTVIRVGESHFAVLTKPVGRMDLETAVQIATRVQNTAEEPLALDRVSIYLSCAVGFCLSTRAPQPTGDSLIEGARTALAEARRNGPSAIRAFSREMQQTRNARAALRDAASLALDHGHIVPWFQPQISTDTGRVTGFEALARWQHPERGLIPPGEFLTALEQDGRIEHLGEVILQQSLMALQTWDQAGLDIPNVGVNFTAEELRNPRLVDRIAWELDRFDMAPRRLCVEVLESVISDTQDDTTCRNINTLAELGCLIDLDDFGTGHASISSLRRFKVARLKIDRSFVTRADQDPEQQRMIAAILTMAERLNLDTLAEGIESVGEHAMLSQLGCGHVQGFGIARPMPLDDTVAWVAAHNSKLHDAVRFTGQGS